MIEISFGKLLLLALIALLVLGPEKLPGAARTAGALLRRVRSGWDSVKSEVERELELEEIRRAARETMAQAQATQQQVQDTVKSVQGSARELGEDVRKQAGDIVDDVKRVADPAPAETPAAAAPAEQVPEAAPTPALPDEGASTDRVTAEAIMRPRDKAGQHLDEEASHGRL